MSARLLLVEDEPQMRIMLQDNLEYEGYEVFSTGSGEDGVEIALRELPDLVLLDVMLPGASGFEVCRRLRVQGMTMPIIMLTARTTESDRIAGLDFGADDYVGKPFSVGELMARVRSQLRRQEHFKRKEGEFVFEDVVVNLRRRVVRRGKTHVSLTSREFELLRYFIAHRGEVVSREQILRDVWSLENSHVTRTVDNFVAKLRNKFEPNPREPKYLMTVHGTGYQFLT